MYSSSHRSGSFLTVWTPERVAQAPDPLDAWVCYVQQVLGVPFPTVKEMAGLRRMARVFFEQHPRADFFTLCRVVQWNRTRNRRYRSVLAVFESWKDAWVQKKLPELDPARVDDDVEERITEALKVETNESWRRRLLASKGRDARRQVLSEWMAMRVSHV